ncbi:ABC transporter ATP-binding protein [uncultured Streptococcus sp.]|uniref:ABC transporter ATP-binding protein n=1 Tax=uncultured Streptococcus sp. TaxID=83427 RepID=UPI0028E459EE|nr:ABC transporter ATP-binding protein [uncultured Streptococcus sp.]
MIQCNNVVKAFNKNKVIKGINLNLENGKITSLVGKNGAGKSTLIGLIMGYYRCDSGTITKDKVSVMPDAASMYPTWSGIEFLKFMSQLKGAEFSEALELASRLGIKDKLKNKISDFSFGMKKKLSFIQCAIGSYQSYIFDEPTSGVDVPSALIMLDIIKELKSNGSAVLLTSHNIDELERVSDYIYIIESGYITQQGSVEEIINNKVGGLVYCLVSPQAESLSQALELQKYIRSFQNQELELIFSDSLEASAILKELIASYTISEFYQKKRSLIESVYEKL